MSINSRLVKKYYDKRAACQVLGVLMVEPQRINDDNYLLTAEDFSQGMHETLFIAIHNLAIKDVKEIKVGDVENYLAVTNEMSHKNIFENKENVDWLYKIYEDATPINFDYYYKRVKKMSVLRSYLKQGIDVAELLNLEELDPIKKKKQQEKFDLMEIEGVILHYEKKVSKVRNQFIIKDASKSRKAGDNATELYEQLKESPDFGMGFESEYLNAITMGMKKGQFFLETRDSGLGKTRVALRRLVNIACPYLWDFKEQEFVPNPNGKGHGALYIGTEMDQYRELEPIMWAFVAGVEESKIRLCELTTEEDLRVQKAIEILKNSNLFLEHNPNYNIEYLWKTVEEFKKNYDIYAVSLDYIELNAALTGDFTNNTKGMGVREDQVLLDLSTNLKNIAEELDVFVLGFTQTTDEARRDGARDQRAIKGARSLPNRADVGMVSFEPTKKELQKIDPVLTAKGIVQHKYPNISYSIYKNRGGLQQYRDIKVWGYQDLGTMEFIDMFCTDKNYKLMNINPTKLKVIDNVIENF